MTTFYDNNKDKKTTLNNSDVSRLKMAYKTAPNFNSITPANLFKKLDDKYSNKGTLSVICYTLKKFFSDINDEKRSKYFGDKGAELSKNVNEMEAQNRLTNNEINNWKTQDEILDLMNNLPINSWTNYMRFLLLAMCTMQPPLRKDFYQSVKFIFNKKDDNGKDNYVLLKSPSKGKSYYIVNHDKVSKFDKFTTNEAKIIEITNNELINMLLESHKKKKRDHVFCTEELEPYSLKSISKVLLQRPFDLNFNILRSSYITNYFNNPDKNYLAARQELSRKMRHSVEKQMLNYEKRNGGRIMHDESDINYE